MFCITSFDGFVTVLYRYNYEYGRDRYRYCVCMYCVFYAVFVACDLFTKKHKRKTLNETVVARATAFPILSPALSPHDM